MITYTYRGEKTVVTTDRFNCRIGIHGQLVFEQKVWSDGNQKAHKFIVHADELMTVANRALEQVNRIAGTNYKITLDSYQV